MESRLVQYVVVRSDLATKLNWPTGALIAQACHACTAIIKLFYQDANTMQYLDDLDNMHKVVLEIPDEKSIIELSDTLQANQIDHKLWIEQPENLPTCIALKPYQKQDVQKYFKKLKLFNKM